MSELLALEEAQARLIALAPLLPSETCPVSQAAGRYLARDLTALRTQPASDLSAMDGYAVAGAGPWQMVGESRAGAGFEGSLSVGQCAAISTGAQMPGGADRVLIKEDAQIEGSLVQASHSPKPGEHIRAKGCDFQEGETLLSSGARLTPGALALVITGGNLHVEVRRRARVAILDCGDELSSDPAHCAPGQVPASNGVMIASMLAGLASEIQQPPPIPDSRDALVDAFRRCKDADLLITSGGASVGDHDHIKPALSVWGASIEFWKVAIKPGKPLLIAERGNQIIIGLPGNPASAFVTCFLFVLPVIRAMMGARSVLPQTELKPLATALPEGGGRREFLRARLIDGVVEPAPVQLSSALRSLAAADCLIDRPAAAQALEKGQLVPVYDLRALG